MTAIATHTKLTRLGRSAARSQAGMTLLEILIVLAILALVMGLLVGPKVIRAFQSSRTDIARLAVKKLADEAFTQWATQHSSKPCPASIDELAEYSNSKDLKDPWGNPYQMLCGETLPAGVRGGIAVFSYGADGKPSTEDDIKSWD